MKVFNCWLAPCGGTSNLSHVGSKYYGKEKDKVVVDKKKKGVHVSISSVNMIFANFVISHQWELPLS